MSITAQIPYGAYWSTPNARWQGSLQHLHAIKFVAHVAKDELAKRDIEPTSFNYGVLGLTVNQHQSFNGLPWFTNMLGAPAVGGPLINQVCATGVRCLENAVMEIEGGMADNALVATCDRTSNGPQLYYPAPAGPGGAGKHENQLLDNMGDDPYGHFSMLQTAENVAARHQITTEQQHDAVLRRSEQYQDALADDRAFHKRFMSLPFDVPSPNFKKTVGTMEGDEGVFPADPEKLKTLKPVIEGGTITFGGQTHPADGSACIVVTTPDKAKEMAQDKSIKVEIKGFGQARAELGYMPEAPLPAAQNALNMAGWNLDDIDAVKTHNPFIVNDLYFAKESGYDVNKMNNYGCTLVWGHTQAAMGSRGIIELIEELAIKGGGKGIFTGCAAGDTGMAVAIEVSDA
jgi:acetyl-CoA acetyltransferase